MSDATLDLRFPTAIGIATLDISNNKEIESEVLKGIEMVRESQEVEWRCNTLSTLSSDYDLLKHPAIYKELIETVANKVLLFAKEFGITDNALELIDVWANVSERGSFQEYHIHPYSHFAATYYVTAPLNSGAIVLRKPGEMYPLPYVDNYLQHSTVEYEPIVGRLIMFRSNIEHMVEINKSDSERISVTFNFKIKKD